MPVTRLNGPYTWARPFGAEYLKSGQTHYWKWGPAMAAVLHVTAHATNREFHNSTVAVEGLSITCPQPLAEKPHLNLLIRNASTAAIGHYRFYVAEIDF